MHSKSTGKPARDHKKKGGRKIFMGREKFQNALSSLSLFNGNGWRSNKRLIRYPTKSLNLLEYDYDHPLTTRIKPKYQLIIFYYRREKKRRKGFCKSFTMQWFTYFLHIKNATFCFLPKYFYLLHHNLNDRKLLDCIWLGLPEK